MDTNIVQDFEPSPPTESPNIDAESLDTVSRTDVLGSNPEALPIEPIVDNERPTPPDISNTVQESTSDPSSVENPIPAVAIVPGASEVVFNVENDGSLPHSVPMASPEAIEFMSNIRLDELCLCLFSESFNTVSESGDESGSFTVSVQPTYHQLEGLEEEKCFLVHASTQSIIDNIPTGSSIVAYISPKLETLEQHHHEYIKMKANSVDKKTHIRRQGDQLVINTIITQGEKVRQETTSHPLNLLSGLVTEASNLLIMRLMARRKLSQDMVFLCFDAETNLCTSNYTELGFQSQVIGRDTVEVYGIERMIHSDDVPITWHCYFLSDGHLACRVQIGSPVIIRLSRMPILSEPDEQDPKPVFGKKTLIWQEDVQLYSNYLDRKAELIAGHETYLRRHPEMKILLADFMQFLLLRKPEDVITFAAEFFGPFSTAQKRGDTFRSSTIPNPFQVIKDN
ncbi:ciliogenesis-associated TTC17-interacting protein [Pelobates fuscus]|uniref:ciliogenesis-associated TTC17-interacting protein n=1 Tax=Pelobates fuscus TaxID=191477 RepID=UPI002FE4E64B